MHFLVNERPVPIGPGSVLEPGRWLADDSDCAQIMTMAGNGECKLQPYVDFGPDQMNRIVDPAPRFLVIRAGRFGDLLLLTPCIRELKRKWPKCTIAMACLPQYRDALIGLPYIDEFVQYPVEASTIGQSVVICLESLLSLNGKEKEMHITDLFAERMGLQDIVHKKPDLILSSDERNWAFDNYPKDGPKRVAIQVRTSTPARDYPQDKMNAVLKKLHGRGWDVLMLGLPHEITLRGRSIPRMRSCADDKLTFRQSAAALSTADVFLGPDSSMIHVAGALGTPAVGLFATVPWQLRTKYCPTTFVIQAKAGCPIAPCFNAPTTRKGFPVEGPCAPVNKCCALDRIEPDRIIAKLEEMVA